MLWEEKGPYVIKSKKQDHSFNWVVVIKKLEIQHIYADYYMFFVVKI